MEIKAGEYVRTKDGLIDKVQNYSYSQNIWHCENGMCIDECNCIGTHLKDIANHNFNIKELLEEGDIVNRQIVVYIEGEGLVIERAEYIFPYILIEEIKIEEILTHEQYERNYYRLENN